MEKWKIIELGPSLIWSRIISHEELCQEESDTDSNRISNR